MFVQLLQSSLCRTDFFGLLHWCLYAGRAKVGFDVANFVQDSLDVDDSGNVREIHDT